MTSQFLDLPDELLVFILSSLPLHELLACRYSCRKLRDIILGDRLSQQRIQSLEHCMKDFSSPSLSTSDFLKSLEEMRMISSTSSPGEEVSMRTEAEPIQSFHKFTFFGGTETAFLLRSGYLIQVRKGNDPGWAYMDLSPKHDLQGYTPALEWKSVHLRGSGIMGWALDFDQDLVAVSLLPYEDPESYFQYMDLRTLRGYWKGNIEIRLVQFTTGTNHKSANKAVVQLDPLEWYDAEFKTHIAIMGGYLVVLLAHYYTASDGSRHDGKYQTVYFVDWVKGHVIHKWHAVEETYLPVLISLSTSTFVMGLKRNWALELYEITENNGALSCIHRRRMLKLPAVQPDTHIIFEKFDETSSVTGRPSALRHPSALPFMVPPSDSILAFYMRASSRSGEKQTLVFSVFTSALRSFIVTIRATWLPWKRDKRTFIVPWNEWGPEFTRWIIVEDFKLPIIRALSGTRCVIYERLTGQMGMVDFNPEHLPWINDWIKRRTGETVGRTWLVDTCPSTILAGEVFKYEIESKLPYFAVGHRVEAGVTFLIDDKCVVLIRPGRRPGFIDGDGDS
ncbi:hypothetical protein F5888DRAFT_1809666 [Russula emetica]|nr:hypothetical protein F5888DRAFT_1809666 [Russula emetica]